MGESVAVLSDKRLDGTKYLRVGYGFVDGAAAAEHLLAERHPCPSGVFGAFRPSVAGERPPQVLPQFLEFVGLEGALQAHIAVSLEEALESGT